jgi:hypothetical protein
VAARQDIELLTCHLELRQSVNRSWNPDDPHQDGLTDVGLNDPDIRYASSPSPWSSTRSGLLEEHRRFVAASQLLDELPDEFRPFLLPDFATRLGDQPAAFRARLGSFLLTWSQKHPNDATALSFELPPAPAV